MQPLRFEKERRYYKASDSIEIQRLDFCDRKTF